MFRVFYITLLCLMALCRPSHSETKYAFLNGNPYVAQDKLIADIVDNQLAAGDFTTEGIAAIKGGGPFAVGAEALRPLGAVREICLTFALKDSGTEMLVFRVVHENGCGDWGVSIQTQSSKVSNVAMVRLPFLEGDHENCGVPGILPPIPEGARFFTLPATASCRTRDKLNVAPGDEELKESCAIAKGICNEKN